MKNEDSLNLFEDALSRLQAGESLQSVLQSLPQDTDLFEMIRTASLLNVPEEKLRFADQRIQNKSKQAFLQAALSLDSKPGKRGLIGWLQGLRLASQLALVVIVLFFSLTITGIVSAKALPGQPLYGVKRLVEQTQLALTRDSLGRLQFEEILDARRVYEVIRLQKSERWQDVHFAGWMNQDPDGSWQVQGVPVVLDEKSPLWNPMLNGAYVEVSGELNQQGVVVRQIELRLFKLHGTLQFIEPNTWQVNGVPLQISPETQTQVLISRGLVVDVTAIRLNNDQYMALVINVARPEAERQENIETHPQSSITPSPQSTDPLIKTQLNTATVISPLILVTEDLDDINLDDELEENKTILETEVHSSEYSTDEPEYQPTTPEPKETDKPSYEITRTRTKEPDDD